MPELLQTAVQHTVHYKMYHVMHFATADSHTLNSNLLMSDQEVCPYIKMSSQNYHLSQNAVFGSQIH